MPCRVGRWNTRWDKTRLRIECTSVVMGCLLAAVACGRDTTVPFKRPGPQGAARVDSVQVADPKNATPAATEAPEAQRFADAPSKIQVGAVSIDRGRGHIHAVLPRTLEQEGGDLLLLVSDDEGLLALEHSEEQGGNYGPPNALVNLPPPSAACQMLTGSLQAPSAAQLLAETTHTCPIVPEASDGEAQTLIRTFYILSREPHPRLLEHIAVRSHPEGQDSPPNIALSAELHGVDVDEDGQEDLQLTVKPSIGDQALAAIALHLIDRPGGLVWDTKEPEASLRALADQAHKALSRKPEQALSLAMQVYALHQALCRGGAALLDVGGHNGILCERSIALGRALSVAMAASSKQGKVLDALLTQAKLTSLQVRLLPVDERRAHDAIASLPREGDFVFSEGPSFLVRPLPAVHRPLVAFLDEHHLLLRGEPPESYSLTDGSRSPTSVVAPLALLTDPDRRFVATEIVRDCRGDRLRVFPVSQVMMGRSVGAPAAELLIKPGTETCSGPRSPAQPSPFTLLRWSRSELLFTEGYTPWLLSVNDELQSTQPAQALQPEQPLPPPFEPDALATARPLYALATSAGIALVDLASHRARLLQSEGLPNKIDSLSLSPSGERLAVLSGNRIWIGTPRSSSP